MDREDHIEKGNAANNTDKNIKRDFDAQGEFFNSGITRNIDYRLKMLRRLKTAILNNERKIAEALQQDLGKPEQETVTTEIGMVIQEINMMLKHLEKWSRKKKCRTNLINMPGKSFTIREPYGRILIISPWNYPFHLVILPLVGAIAGGNCAIIKPSEISPSTSKVIKDLINQTFDSQYIQVIEGAIEETSDLLERSFDKIFFTGSSKVGGIVMEKAAKHLTPVVLELGGKSPCIVDKNCNMDIAVKRILFGKGINAGQTCVAPDYVLVHESVKGIFYKKCEERIKDFYGATYEGSKDYCKIINDAHFERLQVYLKNGKIIIGGHSNKQKRHIELTLIEVTDMEQPIMKEEIFGPILPVMEFRNMSDIQKMIAYNPNPLALYIFSNDHHFIDSIVQRIPFGGGCINDTLMHLTNENLPFGGRGMSGFGRYHGKHSFEVFTHEKGILNRSTAFDLKLKYPPYNNKVMSFLKKWMYK